MARNRQRRFRRAFLLPDGIAAEFRKAAESSMGKTTINWCDLTFNPWEGCTRVSPACVHCYAEARDQRHLTEAVDHWGPGAPRRTTSDQSWRKPIAWNRQAARSGKRLRVFCASLGDVFDHEAPVGQRERLWELIRSTHHLDWLLLTKRTQNIRLMLPGDWGDGYTNVWLGATCENRRHGVPRIEELRQIPAVVRFLSCEPLLEDLGNLDLTGIDWLIVGGESGAEARPFDIQWAKNLVSQCEEQGVAPWVKQLGRRPSSGGKELVITTEKGRRSGHAGDLDRWPDLLAELKVRQLPIPRMLAVRDEEVEVGV